MTLNAPQGERILHAPESGRFYQRTGEVVLEVPKAKGEGVREPTIADARKHGFLYSVTEGLKVLAKGGLDAWRREHMLKLAHANPPAPGEPIEEWVRRIDRMSQEYGDAAAERGTEVHKQIERFFRLGEECPDPVVMKAALEIIAHYPDYLILPEVRFAVPRLGYAGTMDMLLIPKPSGEGLPRVIADMKTKNLANWDKPMTENGLQLGGYAEANPEVEALDTIAIDRVTGETRFFRWGEKWKRTQSMTTAQLRAGWKTCFDMCCFVNGYDPRLWAPEENDEPA